MVDKVFISSDTWLSLPSVAVGPENWPNFAHGRSVQAGNWPNCRSVQAGNWPVQFSHPGKGSARNDYIHKF